MVGFSSTEIQTQIEKFLTTQVSSTRTKLGLRDILGMRDKVYDLLTTTLLLRPDSYFYLVWQTSNRLEGLRSLQATDVGLISAQSTLLDFRTKRISSTAELVNAQAAILSLNAGLNSRRAGQGIRGSIGPAVDRFNRSTDRFIRGELSPNVVRSGAVTETPEEIRTQLTGLLAGVLVRHTSLRTLAIAITEASTRLDAVSLPESAVRDIVSRMSDRLVALQTTLEGDDALSESREAMLEILVMRTLLTRASGFRAPTTNAAPLAGDPTILTLAGGGTSTPGSLTGATSGPFNYDAGATNLLRMQIGTPVIQVDVTLLGGSNAGMQSAPLTLPVAFGSTEEFSLSVDGGTPQSTTPVSGSYATAALLATYLNGLITGATVTDSGGRIVITSDSFGDSSSIEVFASSDDQLLFIEDVPMETTFNRGVGVEIDEILDTIGAATAQVSAEEVRADFDDVSGTISTGTPTIVDAVTASGSDLILTQNSTTVVSPSTNFELLGVRPGMAIDITAPSTFTAAVVTVTDNTLVLDAPIPTSGTGIYEVGSDFRAVPDGARVILAASVNYRNSGSYYVDVGGGAIAHLTLDRAIPVSTVTETVSGPVFTSFLKISALTIGPIDGIAAFPADVGLTALGFMALVTQDQGLSASATLTGVDLLARGVRAGDKLRLDFSGPLPEQTVASLTPTTLSFTPGVEFQAGDPTYILASARSDSWDVLAAAAQVWLDDEAQSDTADLEFQVGRLLRGANPSPQITTAITRYLAGLTYLQAALAAYVVPEERGILNVIRTLDEQGMDRARDLLIDLNLEEFFTMPKDSVSYATHLIREAADVTRQIAPVGKNFKSKIPGEQQTILYNQDHPYDPVGSDLAD